MRTVSTTAILRRNLKGTRVSASELRRKSNGLIGSYNAQLGPVLTAQRRE